MKNFFRKFAEAFKRNLLESLELLGNNYRYYR